MRATSYTLVLLEPGPQFHDRSFDDRIWGIGLRADDPRVHDEARWRGQNLLGQALMQARARLRA